MGFMNLGVISLGFTPVTANPAMSAGIKSISVIKNGKFHGPIIPTTSNGLY